MLVFSLRRHTALGFEPLPVPDPVALPEPLAAPEPLPLVDPLPDLLDVPLFSCCHPCNSCQCRVVLGPRCG